MPASSHLAAVGENGVVAPVVPGVPALGLGLGLGLVILLIATRCGPPT